MAAKSTPSGLHEAPDQWSLCQAFIEHAPLPMAAMEGAGHLVREVNSAFCRLLDKSGDELVGRSFAEIVRDNPECLELLDRVFERGQPASRAEPEPGESRPLLWAYTMWPVMADAQVAGIMLQVTETTQHHDQAVAINEALVLGSVRQHELTAAAESSNARLQVEIAAREKALREVSEKARLLDLSFDAIVVRDPEGRVTYWNQGAEDLYGWPREAALGCVSHVLLKTEFAIPVEQMVAELHRDNRWTGDLTHTKRDGERVTVLARKTLDRDQQGNILAVLEYFTDITARKQDQEALRASEERYRSLFDSIDEGFCVVEVLFNESGRCIDYLFLEVNPSFARHSGLHDALGKRMREVTPDLEAHWCETYGEVARTGRPVRFENEAKAMHRWFDVYAFRLGDEAGRKVAILFTDITARKRAEERLRLSRDEIGLRASRLEEKVTDRTGELMATNQQLEAFVYSIAHDLRAPLRSMQGFSALLIDEAATALTATGRDYARRIDESAQFMDAMLGDLLAFSRIAQRNVELAAVSLGPVVESVLARLQNDIEGAHAVVDISGPWPVVRAHEPTLAQVLFNLASNALKFVAPGVPARVRLRAEEHAVLVRVWVEDNGPGIASDHQAQIFRLFTRLDGEKHPGTGIGLAIVQQGIARMGGSVGVESTPGEGSRFWFELRKA